MRPTPNHRVEQYRVNLPVDHPYYSTRADGNNGVFVMPSPATRTMLRVLASDGLGWQHVSVSLPHVARCPTWTEMCHIKDLFWDDEEVVVQYHPRKSEYVKCHPYVLHLWKPDLIEFPTPPPAMIGPLGVELSAP